jgi:hypothetical protein
MRGINVPIGLSRGTLAVSAFLLKRETACKKILLQILSALPMQFSWLRGKMPTDFISDDQGSE